MLTTPFGNIQITMDGKPVAYTFVPVPNAQSFPDVDGVYLLKFDYLSDGSPHKLCCLLEDASVTGDIESGERFEAISFYCNAGKITIGCEGWFGCPEEHGYDYDGSYLPDGLEISITAQTVSKPFLFGVAWLTHCTGENDVQTWFAADPSITKKQTDIR